MAAVTATAMGAVPAPEPPVPVPSVFAGQLEDWRLALGLGHNAFARHLGISHGYWHLIRTGERRPSADLVTAWLRLAPQPWRAALQAAVVSDLTSPTGS